MSGLLAAADDNGHAVQALKQSTNKVVAISGTSAQSAAFGANTTVVRLATTTDCWVLFGSNPTAVAATNAGGSFMGAGSVEYWRVDPATKVAVIQDSAAGNLSVTEMV